MIQSPQSISWRDADAAAACAARIAPRLVPGDTVLLDGQVGAGKTHFARSLIQSILDVPEDVPSPTFTLVQTYDTAQGPLWHTDLYRVTSDQEIDELGLVEAFDDAICLVEWPDRLGPVTPADALHMQIAVDDMARHVTLHWTDAKWSARLTGVLADG